MKNILLTVVIIFFFNHSVMAEQEKKKNFFDPTNIDTRIGAQYTDKGFGASGSIAWSETGKVNVSATEGGSWTLGGSWGTDWGLIDYYVSSDEDRTGYYLGTYVPLSTFGVDTGKLMVFPFAGANYTTFEEPQVSGATDSYGAYAGVLALYPVNEQVTAGIYSFYAYGTEYTNALAAAFVGYNFTENLALKTMAGYSDDNYDSGMVYTIRVEHKF